MKRFFLTVIVLFVIGLPSLLPLFNPGFFQSDDGEWMIIRFSAFHEVLRDGQFPVRFLSRLNHSYGYPVANFLYPGFMYLAEPIKLLGFGFVDTLKIVFSISIIGSLFFAFLWLLQLFKRWPAFVGAFVYLYTPYHMYDVYHRGSIGEVLALAVLPFILWQVERNSLFWIVMGIVILIMSHNTLSLLFMGLIILYLGLNIFMAKNKKALSLYYVQIILLGIGVSTFFWLPALYDLRYTIFTQTSISDWSRYFSDLTLVGLSTYCVLFGIIVLFLLKKINIAKHQLTLLFFSIALIAIIFASSVSAPLWSILPVSFIQFPFRFLSLLVVTVSFLSAFIVATVPKQFAIISGVIIIGISLVSSYPFLKPAAYFDKGEGFYSTNEDTTTVKNEYMPIWMKNQPASRAENKIIGINTTVSDIKIRPNSYEFKAHSSTEDGQNARIIINTAYFPGWVGHLVNNDSVNLVKPSKEGKLEVILPIISKEGTAVRVAFTETPLRLLSDIVSVVSFLLLGVVTLRKKLYA